MINIPLHSIAPKTLVVNFWGGPGSGKSTLAADVFAGLKTLGVNCELVKEYAKDLAWSDRKIGPLDQLKILGEQSHREAVLYGKVRIILTDSPVLLGTVYQRRYQNKDYVMAPALAFMKHAENLGVRYINYVLERDKPYNPKGRFETENQAKEIDNEIRDFLRELGLNFEVVTGPQYIRTAHVIQSIKKEFVID